MFVKSTSCGCTYPSDTLHVEGSQTHIPAQLSTGLQVEAGEQSLEQDDEVEFECGVAPLTGCQKTITVKLVCRAGAQESKRELGQVR